MPDKRRQITGITGLAPSKFANRTSFKEGQSGNPAGRPRGSGRFRSGTLAAAALLDAKAEHITERAIEMALAGDAVAARFCLGRILGARRGQPVELALPELAEARDLGGAVAAIAAALGEGRVTPEEALSLSQMLDGFPRVLAASSADRARCEEEEREDPHEALIRELDRIAERETLRQSQALATIPRPSAAGRLIEPAAPPPAPLLSGLPSPAVADLDQ